RNPPRGRDAAAGSTRRRWCGRRRTGHGLDALEATPCTRVPGIGQESEAIPHESFESRHQPKCQPRDLGHTKGGQDSKTDAFKGAKPPWDEEKHLIQRGDGDGHHNRLRQSWRIGTEQQAEREKILDIVKSESAEMQAHRGAKSQWMGNVVGCQAGFERDEMLAQTLKPGSASIEATEPAE